ncbi:MAG TPA: nuclear transport factor 2 family protein [Pyrinomonadaceae bacterium]|nr:nuclear transport factor 2 family protein [Pyrinomonadaceae bacterium]
MKNFLLVMVMVVATTTFGCSQANEEQAIRQTVNELITALNKNDLDTAGRIYSDDYQIVLADGSTTTKAERLGALKSGDLRYEALVVDNLKIRQYGDSAVANYRVTGKTITRAGEQDVNSQAMVMLVKTGGRWQVASSQLTDNGANQTATSPGASQTGAANPAANQSAAADDKTLNKFMDDYLAALMKNSADLAEPFLDAQYIRVGTDGSRLNKDQFIAAIRSGNLKYTSVVADDRMWRKFGNDTAIVTSRATIKASNNGQDISGAYGATTVLRRVGDRWTQISTHLSPAK